MRDALGPNAPHLRDTEPPKGWMSSELWFLLKFYSGLFVAGGLLVWLINYGVKAWR